MLGTAKLPEPRVQLAHFEAMLRLRGDGLPIELVGVHDAHGRGDCLGPADVRAVAPGGESHAGAWPADTVTNCSDVTANISDDRQQLGAVTTDVVTRNDRELENAPPTETITGTDTSADHMLERSLAALGGTAVARGHP